MKRREFLLTSGLLGAGGIQAWNSAREACAADPESNAATPKNERRTRRRILIASAQSSLAPSLTAELNRHYELRLTSPEPIPVSDDFVRSDFGELSSIQPLLRGVDAIVHLGEPVRNAGLSEVIEYCSRGTYNLLQAALAENVRFVIYLSSLRMMREYSSDYQVDENWRPRPTPDSGALPAYLGEFTCREFARQGPLTVVVLRLGDVLAAEEAEQTTDVEAWIDPRDVTRAVALALEKLLNYPPGIDSGWSVMHVVSHSPRSRFPIAKAERILGYRPAFGQQEP